MNIVYILTGSNMGSPLLQLQQAAAAIATACGPVVQQSAIYETAAWGNEAQPNFLNQVLCINTLMNPYKILRQLMAIEQKMGRVRSQPNDPRTIDLDILLYNSLTLNDATLQIPHPRLHLRRFVLVPLAEIAAGFVHPVLQKTIWQLLAHCQDTLHVKKFSA